MTKLTFLLLFMTLCLLSQRVHAQNVPIVVELFTSQSCSSCPPADKVLFDLSSNEDVIALSCHVTYWNHLHWRDTLSKQACTQRQRDYVRALNSRGPYTPQLIIDGRYEMVGSRKKTVHQIIDKQKTDTKQALPVKMAITNKSYLQIDLPEMKQKTNDGYDLVLFAYKQSHHQNIPSGENRGRSITYHHPVQDLVRLGKWDGQEKSIEYDFSSMLKNSSIDGLVLTVHKTSHVGPIVTSGIVKL